MDAHPSDIPMWECLKLASSRPFGRVCILDQGTPVALPMSHRVLGDEATPQLVLRTSPSSSLGRYEGTASYEIDDIDPVGRQAWSVILRGVLRRVEGAHGLPDPQPWMRDARHRWLVLDVSTATGRRFVGVTSADGYSVDWGLHPG